MAEAPPNIVAAMIFLMWFVDTTDLIPGSYPACQWYVWGFMGLAFHGIEGLNDTLGS